MKELFKEVHQLIKMNMWRIIAFELCYRLVTVPAYLWLVNRLILFALRMAGYSYVTVSNLGAFLLKPWTILALLVLLLVALLGLAVEVAAILAAFLRGAYHVKMGIFQMIGAGVIQTVGEIRRGNIKLLSVISVHYMAVNCFFIYRTLIHVKPLNFIIPGILGEPLMRRLIAAAVIVLVAVAVLTMFTSLVCMAERKSFRDSLRRSGELLRGHLLVSLTMLILYNGIVLAVCIGIYFLSTAMTAWFAVEFIDKSRELAVLLVASDKIELALLVLGSIGTVVVSCGVLTVMYFQYGSRLKQSERWDFDFPDDGWPSRKHMLASLAVIAAFSVAVIVDSAANGFAVGDELLTEILVTAHRGSSGRAPENTMEALVAAYEDMADYAEIDVQESGDGVLVICHDTNLKRVAGVNSSPGKLTYEELEKLDVGSWFSPSFAGAKIPTLEEALSYCKGKLKLNIEIKSLGKGSRIPEKVAAMVKEYGFEEQCVITSTSLAYLKRVKEAEPDLKTGYIVSAAYGDYYMDEAIDFLSLRSSSVTARLVEAVHEHGREVHAWTVNGRGELERMRELGVDNIITDFPVHTREVLYQEDEAVNLLGSIRLMLEQGRRVK